VEGYRLLREDRPWSSRGTTLTSAGGTTQLGIRIQEVPGVHH